MTQVHAFADDALRDLDAVGVAAAIGSGEVTPHDVVEAAIARVERVDPQLNAVAFRCFERARTQLLRSGPFTGVPTFLKDNIDVRGLPTCCGSAAITAHPRRRDSLPAKQFLAQGFVPLGKTTLPEFGLTASTEWVGRAPTRNPWNLDRSVGASSGGSAALVAAGAVPIAHGNDGGGSIRIPAAATGLVGLKATRGRLLDQSGARQLPINVACEGVLTRSVRDTAVYLHAAERYRANRKLEPVGPVEGPGSRRLRIGVIRRDVYGNAVHPDVDAVLNSAVETLSREGHDLAETRLRLGGDWVEDFKLYWAALAVLMVAGFGVLHGRSFHPRGLDPFTRGLAGLAGRQPLAVLGAIGRLRQGERLYDEHFTQFDVLLSPVLSHPAPPIGDQAPDQPFEELFAKLTAYVAFTPFNNIGGGPGMAVPHSMMSDGLPGSIHLSARRGDERTLLELAYELELASPFPVITAASVGPAAA